MDKKSVRAFFDACAPKWDDDMIKSERIIEKIMDGARVGEGKAVLDVACGTGVLFSDYLGRNVKSVTAIDLSPAMVEIARGKAAGESVEVLCGDAEQYDFGRTFDCVMVYNAFPHFPDSRRALLSLSRLVATGGTLTVAHGMSREQLMRHHSGSASAVSVDLPELSELVKMLPPSFSPIVQIADDAMYQLTALRVE